MAYCSVIPLFRIQLNIYKQLNQIIKQSHNKKGKSPISSKLVLEFAINQTVFTYSSNVPNYQFLASKETYRKSSRTET